MIHADLSTTIGMKLVFPEGTLEVPYSTFMGAQPDMTNPAVAQTVADAVRDWIYMEREDRGWDFVIRVNQLSANDPDKTTNPASEGLFWRGTGGLKELVGRTYIVKVIWSGVKFEYSFRTPMVPV